MGVCGKCGREFVAKGRFCIKCSTPSPTSEFKEKQPLSKRNKILLTICITVLFTLVGMYPPIQTAYSNEGTPENDQDAVQAFHYFEEEKQVAQEVAASEREFSEAEIAAFMDMYFFTSVLSVNTRDFTIIQSYIDPNGKIYNEHQNFLKHVEKEGIYEEFLSSSLKSVNKVDGGYVVTTNETYNIFKGDGSARKATFESQFYLTVINGELKGHTLNYTKEIATETINPTVEHDEIEMEFTEWDFALFMDMYFYLSVMSINTRDFYWVEGYIDPNGKIYNEHQKFLEYVEKEGITEEFISSRIVNVKEVDGGFIVTTNEEYNIYKGDGTARNATFESEFFLTVKDYSLYAHTLNYTKEIKTKKIY